MLSRDVAAAVAAVTPGGRSHMTSQNDKRVRELDREARRYREAAIQAVEQLEWCVRYLYRLRKIELAEGLARNRAEIIERTRLFQ